MVEQIGPDGQRLLAKASLLDTMTDETRGAHSLVLVDSEQVCDEEVTKAGCQVTILEQLARWYDGRRFVWRGREKRVGRGEVSSGLGFDKATPDQD